MGNVESKKNLGEKVSAAKKKFEEETKIQSARSQLIKETTPKMIPVILQSVSMSFETCSAFLEASLLAAWHLNPAECEQIVLKTCKKVLNAPIIKEEWNWFNNYVLASSIWLFKTSKNDNYMYQELMKIANTYSKNITESMDRIYVLLQRDDDWKKLMAIQNQTIISRQDDPKCGLLREFAAMDEKTDEEVQIFMDGNVGVNLLVAAAKKIDTEFQNYIKQVMGHYGEYQDGPLKKVERCQSKTENDYFECKWPRSAKLLDIVRCSVTFNTLNQLIEGYNGLMNNIKNNPTILKISRVKNGFIDKNHTGYRDVKVNILYHSQIHQGLSMVCEVQFLIVNYLWEKKKIHKLYNIIRQEEFFRLVVTSSEIEEKTDDNGKDVHVDGKQLQLETNLNLKKHMKHVKFKWSTLYKCSVDPQTKLLGVEGIKKFACINLNTRKVIFEQETKGGLHHNHHWITYNNEKFVTVQTAKNVIKFFSVVSKKPRNDIQIKVENIYEIMLLEFDDNQQNFVMIINKFDSSNNSNEMRLQQHKIDDIRKTLLEKHATICINLSEPINTNIQLRQMVLSSNAESVLIAGGDGKTYFYFIDLKDKSQHKLCSNVLRNTYTPCFIDSERVAIGDSQGIIEIWNIKQKKPIRTVLAFKLSDKEIEDFNKFQIILPPSGSIVGMVASQNILCVCSDKAHVKLYETQQFNEVFKGDYELEPYSVHVTDDLQYLTIGGRSGEMCNVYNIKLG